MNPNLEEDIAADVRRAIEEVKTAGPPALAPVTADDHALSARDAFLAEMDTKVRARMATKGINYEAAFAELTK